MEDFILPGEKQSDEYLDLDLSVFDFDKQEVERLDGSASVVSSTLSSGDEVKVVKSKTGTTSKSGAKVERSKVKSIVKAHKPSIASVLLTVKEPVPNIPRRVVSDKVLAHLDKCDSLLFFPTAYTKHMNSGDIPALSKLILSHLDKNCSISYAYLSPNKLTPKNLIKMLEIVSDLRPDGIMCVNSTEVVENQIKASILLKCTDSKVMFDSLASSAKAQSLAPQFLQITREELLKQKIMRRAWPEEEKRRLIALAESGVDFVKHVHMQMVLTVDPASKKVTEMTMIGRVTSLQVAVSEVL